MIKNLQFIHLRFTIDRLTGYFNHLTNQLNNQLNEVTSRLRD
jgi:hypothetical protein